MYLHNKKNCDTYINQGTNVIGNKIEIEREMSDYIYMYIYILEKFYPSRKMTFLSEYGVNYFRVPRNLDKSYFYRYSSTVYEITKD